jgi:hypothetical protein
MDKLIDSIVKILIRHEEELSDGYKFYCGGWMEAADEDNVNEVLIKIAKEIINLLPKEDKHGDK